MRCVPRAPRSSSQAKQSLDLRRIRGSAREVVKRFLRHPNDVIANERRTLRGALFGMLQTALPLEHGPAVVAVLRHLREDRLEVDLAVAERAEAPGAVDPGLVARV